MSEAATPAPLPPHDPIRLEALQERIGHRFKQKSRLIGALTHPSAPDAARHVRKGLGYERLEFLGDRALGLVIAELLLERHPKEDEGALSKRLVALVRKEALLDVAERLELADAIDLATGSGRAYQRQRETAAADGVEALIAAIFLDGGFQAARAFVRRWWEPLIDRYTAPPKDPKTELQEWAQAKGLPLPRYDVLGADGPDHQPTFVVQATVDGQPPASASGRSKRAAEQAAAEQLLAEIQRPEGA